MTYDTWEANAPECFQFDPLWKAKAYRLSLFLVDIAWKDVTKLMGDRRTVSISDQLFRAAGSVSANISEGYSRGTGKDRARFYEYAFGSARECRNWYYAGRHVLSEKVAAHRMDVCTEIIKLLSTMIARDRKENTRIETKAP